MSPGLLGPPVRAGVPLRDRYAPEIVDEMRRRLRVPAAGGGDAGADDVAWQLLYELEPELYDRLIAGERIHPGISDWLPDTMDTAVEVGAGTGRLTLELARRCRHLVAVEPARRMRQRLVARLRAAGRRGVRVCAADVRALPLPDRRADAVFACSTLTPDSSRCGDAGLAELERVCRPGGMVAVVWPHTPPWLEAHGYHRVAFEGEMVHDFASTAEAVELARIFYPDRVAEVAALRSRHVPYDVLGVNPPRDVAWKIIE